MRAIVRAGQPKAPNHAARIAQLKEEAANVVEAIASGALRGSPALATRLRAAEQELERLEGEQGQAAPVEDVTRLLADLPKRADRALEHLERTLASGDVPRARQEIKDHVGSVTVEADEREIRLFGEQGVAVGLLRAAGGSHASIDGSGGALHAVHWRTGCW